MAAPNPSLRESSAETLRQRCDPGWMSLLTGHVWCRVCSTRQKQCDTDFNTHTQIMFVFPESFLLHTSVLFSDALHGNSAPNRSWRLKSSEFYDVQHQPIKKH